MEFEYVFFFVWLKLFSIWSYRKPWWRLSCLTSSHSFSHSVCFTHFIHLLSLCSGSSIQPTQHTRSHSINISLCSVQSESVLVLRTTENIPKKNQNCISLDVSGSVFVVKKRATLTQKKKKKITHTKSTYNNDENVPLLYVFCLLLPFVFFSNFVRRLISHIHQVLLLSPFCRWNVLMRTIHFSASPHTHLFERVEW